MRAKLRVCASCELIFRAQSKKDPGTCPHCGFSISYSAHYAYGSKCYAWWETQEPWRKKKLEAYNHELTLELGRLNL
jgi:predicted RNA-binding Zn-ribbon protein involved in translation (DUF1610 family)